MAEDLTSTWCPTCAEPAASVRERREGNAVVFEVITGTPDGAWPFASHGHTLWLTLTQLDLEVAACRQPD